MHQFVPDQPVRNSLSARAANFGGRLLAVLLLLSSTSAWAQLSGPQTIPGSYPTVAAAIADLNANGVGAGGVTFSIAAGYSETFASATAGQITLNSTSANPASSGNQITFQKSGSGANPVLTSAGGAGTADAVLSVVGTDYVTFTGIDVAVSGTAVEYGYALFRASATDGSQNNTIMGATITLAKANPNATAGIYGAITNAAGTAITPTSAAGANSNNTFTSNAIANVLSGIVLNGFNNASYYDLNNSVGGAAAASATTGNTITNLGGASTTAAYGIFVNYQAGALLNNNTVNNLSGGGVAATGPIYGVYQGASTATSVAMSYNVVTLTQGGLADAYGVYNLAAGGTGNATTLSNNNVTLTATNTSAGTTNNTGIVGGVVNNAATGTVAMSGNVTRATVTNSSAGSSNNGAIYGVYNATAVNSTTGALTMSGNNTGLTLATTAAAGFGGSSFSGVYNAGAASNTATLSSNTCAYTANQGGSAGIGTSAYGVWNAGAATGALALSTNITTATITVTATANGYTTSVYGVYNSGAVAATGSLTMSGNTPSLAPTVNTTLSAAYSSPYYGVANAGAISSTGTTSISGNTVATTPSLPSAGSYSGAFYGIYTVTGAIAGPLSVTNNSISTAPNLAGAGSHTGAFYGVYNTEAVTSSASVAAAFDKNAVGATSTVSGTGTLSGSFYGLYNGGAITGGASMSTNNVLTSAGNSYRTTGAVYFLYNGSAVNNANTTGSQFTISGNTGGPASGTLALSTNSTSYLVSNSTTTAGPTVLSSNTFQNLSNAGSGLLYGYYNAASPTGTFTADQNTFSSLTQSGTGGFTGVYVLTNINQKQVITGNTFTNIALGATTADNYALNIAYGTAASQVSGNTVTGFTAASSGVLVGLRLGTSLYGGSAYQNTFSGLTNTGAGAVTGIVNTTSTSGTITNIYRNKIYGLSGTNAGSVVTGISVTTGVTMNVYDNLVGGLTAPASTSLTAIAGLSFTGGTTVNAYYNTVYMNATSSGGTFGTSGLYFNTTPTLLARNNVVVNLSTANGAGGYTAAFRRASGTQGTAPSTYSTSSNNNLFYAGQPSNTNVLYIEGTTATVTNPQLRLNTYKTFMATRDQAAVTENVPFASTTGSDALYLHINPSTATQVESGAVALAGTVDNDYDNDVRFGSTGYPASGTNSLGQPLGGGTAPDLGADEGRFTPGVNMAVSSLAYTQVQANTGQGSTNQLALSLTVTTTGTANPLLLSALGAGLNLPADVTMAYLYRGPSATFNINTAAQVASVTSPGGAAPATLTLTPGPSQLLDTGGNYFFLLYDISNTAAPGDNIASTVASVTIGGTTYNASSTPAITQTNATPQYLALLSPLAGTYYIDPTNSHNNAARTYASFTAAVTDLNSRGLSAAVTFEVAPGQTFAEGNGLVPVITATGTSANPIKFERDPDTGVFAASLPNPVLQPTGGTGTIDAALALSGGDYFTFSNLTISQPAASTALEYGIALFRASATNGAQYNTVQNCVITLSTANTNSIGLVSAATNSGGTAQTPTSAAGANSNNTFTSNTISSAASGIVLTGVNAAGFLDANNSVGGAAPASGPTAAATGNTISGFGGAAAAFGVYASYQLAALLNNNALTGSTGGTAAVPTTPASLYGVFQDAGGTAGTDVAMSYNTVSLTSYQAAAAGNFQVGGVYNAAVGVATNAATLSTNTVTLNITANNAGTNSGLVAGVYNAAATGAVALSGNTVTQTVANQAAGSFNGNIYGVYNATAASSATGALALTNNTTALTISTTGGGGFGGTSLSGVYNAGAASNTSALTGNSFTFKATIDGTAGVGPNTYGIYNTGTAVSSLALSGNTVTLQPSSTATTYGYTGSIYGVYSTGSVSGGTATLALSNNKVTGTASLTSNGTAPTVGFYGVYSTGGVSGGSATSATLNQNNVTYSLTLPGTMSMVSAGYGVYSSGTMTGTLAMTNNTVATAPTLSGAGGYSGAFYGVYSAGTVSGSSATALTLSSNSVSASSTLSGTGTLSGALYGVYNSGTITGGAAIGSNSVLTAAGSAYQTTGAINLLYNSGVVNNAATAGNSLAISSNVLGPASGTAALGTSANTNALYALYNSVSTASPVTVSGNTVRNLAFAGTGTVYGYFNSAAASGAYTLSQNTLLGLSSGGNVTGISVGGNLGVVSSNKLAGLSGTAAASVVTGVAVTAASTSATVQNNLIGNLSAPAATGGTALAGINVSGGAAVNLYYNTVYLSGGGAAGFGSSGIYLSSTTPTVTLINNLIDNKATAGTGGLTVALRRTAAALTGYGSTSNYNLYYSAGPLYNDGTNSYATLAAFQAAVAPREARSQTEDVPFASTTSTDASFLHISPTAATVVESSGVVLPSPTTDYDAQARGPYTGNLPPYSVAGTAQANGGGAAPDLGADEGDFVPQPITVTSLTYDRRNATVGLNSTNQSVLGFTVVMGIGSPTQKLNSVDVQLLLNGATLSDISNPKLYLSPTSAFDVNTATLVPTTGALASTYTLTATMAPQLYGGANYFFLTYDIGGTATGGAQVSSAITAATIGGTVYNAGTTPAVASSGSTGFLTIAGPLAGVYYIDQNAATNPARNYTSFTDAVTALNNLGIASFVTFEVAPGQTFTEAGALVPVITATGTSANPIKFERDPSTAVYAAGLANPVLQPTGGTGSYDAALALAGGDYFTFSNLTISQPAASTALELGVAFFRAGAANGAQYNTVQNCTINLNAATAGSAGIYAAPTTASAPATTLTLTAGGQNSNNTLVGNTISNVATGINWVGYNDATLYDANNSFGGVAAATTGNTISSFGVAGTTANGIFTSYQGQALLNNNTVTGTANNAAINGVYQAASSVATDVAMSNNTVTLTQPGTFNTYGVYNAASGAAGNNLTLSNNTVSITSSAATPGTTYGLYNAATSTTATAVALSGNNVTLNISNVTGTPTSAIAGVYNTTAAGSVTLSTNKVSETVTETGTGSYNNPNYGVWNTGAANSATGALTLSGNQVSATASNTAGGGFGAGTTGFYGVYNTGAAANTAALSSNNYTFGITLGSTAGANETVYGIYNTGNVTGALTMNSNAPAFTPTVNATSNGYTGGAYYGVYNTGTVAATGTLTMTGNQPALTATSGAQAFAPSFYGVYNAGAVSSTATTAATLSSNTVTASSTLGAASSTASFYGVYNSVGISGGLTMSSNVVNQTLTLAGAGSYSGPGYGVYNSGAIASPGTLAMSQNTVSTSPGLSSTGSYSGNFFGVYNTAAVSGSSTTALALNSNTVNASSTVSSTGTISGTFNGVYNTGSISGGASISTNNVLTNAGASYLTTGALSFFYNSGSFGGTGTLNGNTVGPAATPGSANLASTSTSYLCYNNNASTGITTFSNNVFRNLNSSGSGSFYAYYNATSVTLTSDFVANQNSFTNLTLGTPTSASVFYGIYLLTNTSQRQVVTNNSFTNISVGNSSTESYAINAAYGAATSQVSGNTVTTFANTGTGALTGIRLGSNLLGGNVYQNTISGLTGSGASVVSGISCAASTSGTTTTIYRNRVSGLSGTAAGSTVNGIVVTAGVTVTLHTNQVSNLTAPASTSTPAVSGLALNGGTTLSAYYNSVYLSGTATGTGSSAALYRGSTGTTTVRNNLLYNERTGGGSNYAIATASATGFVGSVSNPSTNTSDYNLFFAADASKVGNYAGTATTFATWKTTSGGDGSSMSETTATVPAASLFTSTSTGDLSLNAANSAAWYANGTGTQVAAIGTDYSGTTTRPTTVAAGAPDIGATEITPTSTPPAMTATPAAPALSTTQVFTLGGRQLATITYGSTLAARVTASALPSLVTGRYYSGTNPPAPFVAGAKYANAYFDFRDANGDGSGYTFQPVLTYDPASLGTIANEAVQRISERLADGSGYQTAPTTVSTTARTLTGPDQFTRFNLFAISDAGAPLPVTLVKFEAVRQDANAALSWATASEVDNKGFEVQVSLDGQTFRALGFVAARAANSPTGFAYAYLDREAGKAGLRYYRLRQLDNSGQESYSPTRTVDFGGAPATSLTAAPNPFEAELTLTVQARTATAGSLLTLTDASGRTVLTQRVALAAGLSQVPLAGLAGLPTGVYLLSLTVDEQPQHLKIVKR